MINKTDQTNNILQNIRNEIGEFDNSNFFDKVHNKHQNQENICFKENQGSSIGFVQCMMLFEKRLIKEKKKMELKINYTKNNLDQCFLKNESNSCKQQAINNIKQIQNEFLENI